MKQKQDLSAISKTIKNVRKKWGLTAEELAKTVGIDRTYISKIENSNYLPSYDIIRKLSDALHSVELMHTYMNAKYPNASEYYKKIINTKTICQEILSYIEDEQSNKSDAEIINLVIKKHQLTNIDNASELYLRLSNLIKELRQAHKTSFKLTTLIVKHQENKI